MTGLLLLLLSAEVPPISTDRPGNGNAATTVPTGRLQIEASALYSLDAVPGDDVNLISFPTLFRVGLFTGLELRVSSAFGGIDATGPGVEGRTTDTSVGAKAQILANGDWWPDLALMADVYLPSGTGAFTAGVTTPDARVAASWALPHDLGLLLNLGLVVPEDDAGRFAQLLYVVNLACGLAEGLTVFVESFGQIAVDGERSKVLQIDAGAAYLVTDDLQVDLFTQHALTDQSPDLLVSVGLSGRIEQAKHAATVGSVAGGPGETREARTRRCRSAGRRAAPVHAGRTRRSRPGRRCRAPRSSSRWRGSR